MNKMEMQNGERQIKYANQFKPSVLNTWYVLCIADHLHANASENSENTKGIKHNCKYFIPNAVHICCI